MFIAVIRPQRLTIVFRRLFTIDYRPPKESEKEKQTEKEYLFSTIFFHLPTIGRRPEHTDQIEPLRGSVIINKLNGGFHPPLSIFCPFGAIRYVHCCHPSPTL